MFTIHAKIKTLKKKILVGGGFLFSYAKGQFNWPIAKRLLELQMGPK
jgi:hypothetical protein